MEAKKLDDLTIKEILFKAFEKGFNKNKDNVWLEHKKGSEKIFVHVYIPEQLFLIKCYGYRISDCCYQDEYIYYGEEIYIAEVDDFYINELYLEYTSQNQ